MFFPSVNYTWFLRELEFAREKVFHLNFGWSYFLMCACAYSLGEQDHYVSWVLILVRAGIFS